MSEQNLPPPGWALVPIEPTPEIIAAMVSSVWLPSCYQALLVAAPQPVAQPGDVHCYKHDPDEPVPGCKYCDTQAKLEQAASEDVNDTNAILASRYFDLLKVVEAYEKHGVTCQTFRHFVDTPCAECNTTAETRQTAQEGNT